MRKLGQRGRGWLKGFHILLVCAWMGTAFSMMLISMLKGFTSKGDELYAYNLAIKLMDDYIIIPAAIGTLVTGLIFSLFTNWGFFKHKWITFKWIVTVSLILFGTFWLGPWTNGATAIADAERALALQNQTYIYNRNMANIFGSAQALILIVVIFISVFKPWKKKAAK